MLIPRWRVQEIKEKKGEVRRKKEEEGEEEKEEEEEDGGEEGRLCLYSNRIQIKPYLLFCDKSICVSQLVRKVKMQTFHTQ